MAELWSGLGGVLGEGEGWTPTSRLQYTNTEVLLMIWSHSVSGCTILEYRMDFQKTSQCGCPQNSTNVYLQDVVSVKYT